MAIVQLTGVGKSYPNGFNAVRGFNLTTTDWTMDQAMAFIISGGAIAPDPVSFGRRGDA